MDGIVIFTVASGSVNGETRVKLDGEAAALGLKKTLPASEGGTLQLPEGMYAGTVEIEDQMEQLRAYYRTLVDIMRKLNIKGKYFISVSASPTFVCGEL